MGILSIKTHKIDNKKLKYDISKDYFKKIKPRESYISYRFKDLILDFTTDTSYRKVEKRLNRIRLSDKDGIKARTICNIASNEGKNIQENIEKQTEEILMGNGFTSDGEPLFDIENKKENNQHITEIDLYNVIKDNNLIVDRKYINPEFYEKEAYNVSIDDVCVKKQKENRKGDEDPKAKKQIRETVAHVEKTETRMLLNGDNLFKVFLSILALIINSGFKIGNPIVFFVDGEKKLHNTINSLFSWANYKIILDWPHLTKKCRECLSMALKGSIIRNEIIDTIKPMLWNGNIDSAINYLKMIPKEKIKNKEYLKKLIGYFERNIDNIPCYNIRSYLGLRNSSNLGEKANDLIVSDRQKNNGMSWSLKGSTALTSISAVYKNNQSKNWIKNNHINLKIA
jgi:hypothetical protein